MTLRNVELTWGLSVGQMTGAIVRTLSENPHPVPSTLQFNLPLELAIQNSPRAMGNDTFTVPLAVTKLVTYLTECDAATHPKLFSTEPRNHDLIVDIIYALNGGAIGSAEPGVLPNEMMPTDAAHVLKLWIAHVPGEAGLFPETMRPEFVRVCVPPAENTGKSVNFNILPDKLEALVWKLPAIYMETIRSILSFLNKWSTVAPEDMTTLQAIELVFTSYPQPFQHVLCYLLHHFDSLFLTEDSELTAHLQSLVFGSPGAVVFGSPHINMTSPRTRTPVLSRNNTVESSTTAHVVSGNSAHPGGEHALAADATTHTSTAAPGTPGPASSPATPADSPAPSTPTRIKKSKTVKSATTKSPARVKKVKEAEDGAAANDDSSPQRARSKSGKTTKSTPKSTSEKSARSASTGAAEDVLSPKTKKPKKSTGSADGAGVETPPGSTEKVSKHKKSKTTGSTNPKASVSSDAAPAASSDHGNAKTLSRSASAEPESISTTSQTLDDSKSESKSSSKNNKSPEKSPEQSADASEVTQTSSAAPVASIDHEESSSLAEESSSEDESSSDTSGEPVKKPKSDAVSSSNASSPQLMRRRSKELLGAIMAVIESTETGAAVSAQSKVRARRSDKGANRSAGSSPASSMDLATSSLQAASSPSLSTQADESPESEKKVSPSEGESSNGHGSGSRSATPERSSKKSSSKEQSNGSEDNPAKKKKKDKLADSDEGSDSGSSSSGKKSRSAVAEANAAADSPGKKTRITVSQPVETN